MKPYIYIDNRKHFLSENTKAFETPWNPIDDLLETLSVHKNLKVFKNLKKHLLLRVQNYTKVSLWVQSLTSNSLPVHTMQSVELRVTGLATNAARGTLYEPT